MGKKGRGGGRGSGEEGGRRGRGSGGEEEGIVSLGLSTRLTQHILYTLLSLPLPASSCPHPFPYHWALGWGRGPVPSLLCIFF